MRIRLPAVAALALCSVCGWFGQLGGTARADAARAVDRAASSGLALGVGVGTENVTIGGHALYYMQLRAARFRIALHAGAGFLPGPAEDPTKWGMTGGSFLAFGKRNRLVVGLIGGTLAWETYTLYGEQLAVRQALGVGLSAGGELVTRRGFTIRGSIGPGLAVGRATALDERETLARGRGVHVDRIQVMVRRGAHPIGVAAITIALVACSDAPRCKPIEHCDVRTKRCQRAALEHAICLRGRGEPPDLDVPVVTLAQEQFLEETRQAAQDDSEATRQMRSALSHFDLVAPPSEDEDVRVARARRVAGLYDSQERRITLIEDGSPWDSSDNVLTLVHEMVHALQDAAGELSPQPRVSSFDQALVRSALAEGEATLLVDEAAAEGFGFAFGELDYARALASYRRSSFSWVARSESPFDVAGSGFAYAFGASYLWPLRRDRGAPAIAEAQEQRPVSAYAIMNRDPEDHALRENDLGESAAPVLPELTRVGCYRLGRFVYEAWRDAADRRSLPEGTNFVADALCVFVDPEALDAEASVRATWRVRFSSEAAAAQAHRSTAGRSGTQSEGADVWWTRGRFDAPLPPFQEWEAAPAQDFGFEREQPAAGRIECLRRRLRAGALD